MIKLDPELFAATLHHLKIVLGDDADFDARSQYVEAHRSLFPNDVARAEKGEKESFRQHVMGMLAKHWKGKYSNAGGPEIGRLDADGNLIPKETKEPYENEIHYKFL